jgi:chromosome segregation ATPase
MSRLPLAACLPALLLIAGLATAQTQRAGGGNAMAQQYQELAKERTQLKAQIAKLEAERDEMQKQLKAASAERDGLKAKVGAAQASAASDKAHSESTEAALAENRRKLEELVGRFRELAKTLRDTEAERIQLAGDLGIRRRELEVCVDHNHKLVGLSHEVLDRYEHVGLFESLARAEPFTRIKRTEVENLSDEYRDRVDAEKTAAPAAGPPAPHGDPP